MASARRPPVRALSLHVHERFRVWLVGGRYLMRQRPRQSGYTGAKFSSGRNQPPPRRVRGGGMLRELPHMEPDQILIERTLQGELTAFEGLVERHRGIVFRVAARIVGPDDAEDVSQDAFLRAFHRLDQYRGTAPFRTWLLQITQNTALNALAWTRRRPTETASEAPEPADRDPIRHPAAELERRERQERLELKLRALRPEYRRLLVL